MMAVWMAAKWVQRTADSTAIPSVDVSAFSTVEWMGHRTAEKTASLRVGDQAAEMAE